MKWTAINVLTDLGYGGIQQVARFIDEKLKTDTIRSKTISLDQYAPSDSANKKLVKWMKIRSGLKKDLALFDCRVLIVHHPIASLLIPWAYRELIIYVIHGPISIPGDKRYLSRVCSRVLGLLACWKSKKIVTVSYGLKNDISRLFLSKSITIHNAPSVDFFVANEEKNRFDYLNTYECIRLIQFGRFCEQKNQKYSIKILHALIMSGFKAQLVLIGSGPGQAMLQTFAEQLGLSVGRTSASSTNCLDVVFVEPMRGLSWIADYFDVAIFPSRYEGLNISILECVSIGLPVISSDCKYGPSEIYDKLIDVCGGEVLAKKYMRLLGENVERDNGIGSWVEAIISMKLNIKPTPQAQMTRISLCSDMHKAWTRTILECAENLHS